MHPSTNSLLVCQLLCLWNVWPECDCPQEFSSSKRAPQACRLCPCLCCPWKPPSQPVIHAVDYFNPGLSSLREGELDRISSVEKNTVLSSICLQDEWVGFMCSLCAHVYAISVYVHIYIYISLCAYVFVCICLCIYIHVCVYMSVYAYICMYTYVCKSICTHIYFYIFLYLSV